MRFDKFEGKLHVTLDREERYDWPISKQLQAIHEMYPDYDVIHATRTEDGWEISPLPTIKLGTPLSPSFQRFLDNS